MPRSIIIAGLNEYSEVREQGGWCMPRSIIIGHKTELSKDGYEILRAGNAIAEPRSCI